MKQAIFIFLLCFLFPSFSWATDYDVGASETYTTIQACVTAKSSESGARCLVKDDKIYTESVTIGSGGSGGTYFTIENYPGDSPILNASGYNNGITLSNNVDFVKIIGLEIKNAADFGITNTADTHGNNNDHITIQDNVIHDNGNAAGGGDHEHYQGGVFFCAEGGDYVFSNITVDGNTIYKNIYIGIGFYGPDGTESHDITVTDNLVYLNAATPQTYADTHTLHMSNIDTFEISGNYFYMCQKSPRFEGSGAYPTQNGTVYNNVFAYMGEVTVDLNQDVLDNTFKNNIIAFSGMTSVEIKEATVETSNNLFYNNVIFNGSYIGIFQYSDATTTGFQNNIFYGGHSLGALYRDTGSWGTHDYNNYYGMTYATGSGSSDGQQTIAQWAGAGQDETHSVNVDPSFDNPDYFDFTTSHASLQNTGNNPTGDCDEIGLCSNFVDSTKIFPHISLTVDSSSNDGGSPSKTIDHKNLLNTGTYAWNSGTTSPSVGSPAWVIYTVDGGPRNVQYIGLQDIGYDWNARSPNDFQILTSTNGVDYTERLDTTLVNTSNNDWSQQVQWFELTSGSVSASYVKLNITSASCYSTSCSSGNLYVQEFYAIGPLGGGSPATPPTLSSATIDSPGQALTLVFNEAVTQGSGYEDVDFNLDCDGGGDDISVTYLAGDGTTTHIYTISKIIHDGETCDLDFTDDDSSGDDLEDIEGDDLETITSDSVTNNSEVGSVVTGPASVGGMSIY